MCTSFIVYAAFKRCIVRIYRIEIVFKHSEWPLYKFALWSKVIKLNITTQLNIDYFVYNLSKTIEEFKLRIPKYTHIYDKMLCNLATNACELIYSKMCNSAGVSSRMSYKATAAHHIPTL